MRLLLGLLHSGASELALRFAASSRSVVHTIRCKCISEAVYEPLAVRVIIAEVTSSLAQVLFSKQCFPQFVLPEIALGAFTRICRFHETGFASLCSFGRCLVSALSCFRRERLVPFLHPHKVLSPRPVMCHFCGIAGWRGVLVDLLMGVWERTGSIGR